MKLHINTEDLLLLIPHIRHGMKKKQADKNKVNPRLECIGVKAKLTAESHL